MIKSDTIKYNDKTIYTDTVQLELKLRDKKNHHLLVNKVS